MASIEHPNTKSERAQLRAIRRSAVLRRLRNFAIVVVLLAVFVEWAGAPHVLVTYTYVQRGTRKVYLTGRYLGPEGWKEIRADTHGAGCPFVVLVPLDHSLRSRVQSAWHGLIRNLHS